MAAISQEKHPIGLKKVPGTFLEIRGRYEVKFVVPAVRTGEVLARVRCHPAGFVTAYGQRRVNNAYFDTHGYGCVADNLAGIADRAKLRLRWYGDDPTAARPVLEVKRKAGGLGTKTAWEIDRLLDLTGITWRELFRTFNRQNPGELAIWSAALCNPTLINAYARQYFISTDGLVRLTVDRDLIAFDQTYSCRPNFRFGGSRLNTIVIELKADVCHAHRLSAIANHFPWPPVAFSKYTAALTGAADPQPLAPPRVEAVTTTKEERVAA